MSDGDELPLRRPLYVLTTTLYLGVVGVIVTGFIFGPDLQALAQYGGIVTIGAIPLAWWLSGRSSGFAGFAPSNLGFLAGVLLVAGIGFPAFGLVDMEDSIISFLILVVAALALGRYLEGETTRRFGHLWGAELEDDGSDDDSTDDSSEDNSAANNSAAADGDPDEPDTRQDDENAKPAATERDE